MKLHIKWFMIFQRFYLVSLVFQILIVLLLGSIFSFSADMREKQFLEYVEGHPFKDSGENSFSAGGVYDTLNQELLDNLTKPIPESVFTNFSNRMLAHYGYSPIEQVRTEQVSLIIVTSEKYLGDFVLELVSFSSFEFLDNDQSYYISNPNNPYLFNLWENISAPILSKEYKVKFKGDVIINVDLKNNLITDELPSELSFIVDVNYKLLFSPTQLYRFLLAYEYVSEGDDKYISPVNIGKMTFSYRYDLEHYIEGFLEFEKTNEIGLKYFLYAPAVALVISANLHFTYIFRKNRRDKKFLELTGVDTAGFTSISFIAFNSVYILSSIIGVLIGIEFVVATCIIVLLNGGMYLRWFKMNFQDVVQLMLGMIFVGGLMGVMLVLYMPLVLVSFFISVVFSLSFALLIRKFVDLIIGQQRIRRRLTHGVFFAIVLLFMFSNLILIYNFNINEDQRVQRLVLDGSSCDTQELCVDISIIHTEILNIKTDILITSIEKFRSVMNSLHMGGNSDQLVEGDSYISNSYFSSFHWSIGIRRRISFLYQNESLHLSITPAQVIDRIPGYSGDNWILIDINSLPQRLEPDEFFEIGGDRLSYLTGMKSFFFFNDMDVFSISAIIFFAIQIFTLIVLYSGEKKAYKREVDAIARTLTLFAADFRPLKISDILTVFEFTWPIVVGSLLSIVTVTIKTLSGRIEIAHLVRFNRILILLLIHSAIWIVGIVFIFWRGRNE